MSDTETGMLALRNSGLYSRVRGLRPGSAGRASRSAARRRRAALPFPVAAAWIAPVCPYDLRAGYAGKDAHIVRKRARMVNPGAHIVRKCARMVNPGAYIVRKCVNLPYGTHFR